MKDLIRYIKNLIKTKKVKPEEDFPPEKLPEEDYSSGTMKLMWDSATGDFAVDFDISDASDASSDTLALLLFYLQGSELNTFILRSLKYRDEELPEDFYENVVEKWSGMVNMEEQISRMGRAVVGASDVFNFKNLK